MRINARGCSPANDNDSHKTPDIVKTTLIIENLQVYAFHGVLPQEHTVGGEYLVSLRVDYPFEEATLSDRLDDTLDYGRLVSLVQEEMAVPSRLVEHVAGRLVRRIVGDYPQTQHAWVRLVKCNPPMGVACQGAGVELEWSVKNAQYHC